jgi:hypothetical protein
VEEVEEEKKERGLACTACVDTNEDSFGGQNISSPSYMFCGLTIKLVGIVEYSLNPGRRET